MEIEWSVRANMSAFFCLPAENVKADDWGRLLLDFSDLPGVNLSDCLLCKKVSRGRSNAKRGCRKALLVSSPPRLEEGSQKFFPSSMTK